MPDWAVLLGALADRGLRPTDDTPEPVGGGDISAAWRLATLDGPVFLKTGPASDLEMFTGERDGLAEIAAAAAVRVPQPLCVAQAGDYAVLALEWLDLGQPRAGAARVLGEQLAALHRQRGAQHGWHRDNTIGRTPQPNPRADDWVAFFRDQRLRHQLRLAAAQGFGGELQADGRWLCEHLHALFDGYEPDPSLLHGDLWGGNWGVAAGAPVIYDPATYYGDREADLAMTSLFGGFDRGFYDAYEASWPLAPGAERRQPLYQLYHVLNHLNLFGRGYLGRALALLGELRRSIGA